MQAMPAVRVLVLAVAAVLALLVACGGDGARVGGSPQPVEGGLPSQFPDDFPLYPNLEIARSTPLGQRYIVEASSEDSVQAIVDFYERELAKGRWELVATEEAPDPPSTTLRFTAPDLGMEGSIIVLVNPSEEGLTTVGIAMPIEAADGD